MKTFWKFLCATALILSFAACNEKDDENDTPADSDLAAKIIGSWQVDRMTLAGTSVDPSQYDLKATITFNADGRGTVATERQSYDANYTIHGTTVEIHLPDGNMPLKVDNITSDEMTVTTENIPWPRVQASVTLHLKRVSNNGGNNGGNNNGGNGSTEGGTSFDGTVGITIGTPSWERYNSQAYIAIFQWTIKTNGLNIKLRSFFDNDEGKTYSFGIGYFPVGAEGTNLPQYFNGDKEINSHRIISANADSTEFTFISKIVIDNRKQARAYVYLSDGQFHYSNPFIIDPADANGNNNGGNNNGSEFGVTMPEFIENTATTIAIYASFTGNITSPEPFQNATCGFIWCPASQGAPTMSDNVIDCTESAFQNNGQRFIGKIEGLTPATEYNIAAFLRMSPDSQPIIGNHKTFKTQNNGGTDNGGGHHSSSDTNWITVNHVMPYSETSVEISINAYFDSGMPVAIGACYNTTGNPTINDNVYNGLEHINLETMQGDETIIDFFPNNDGSRTVKFLITDLQPNTTYYFRVFMQWASDDIHPIIYTNAGSTTTGRAK